MEVYFKNSFIKDFKKLPAGKKKEIKKLCVEVFPTIHTLQELKNYSIKQIKGFKNYYRIRVGEYRIGFKKSGNKVIFMRVLHRKDIYKFFP